MKNLYFIISVYKKTRASIKKTFRFRLAKRQKPQFAGVNEDFWSKRNDKMNVFFEALIIICSFMLLGACEQMVTGVDVEPQKAKLVLTCFLCPENGDSLIYANLSHSYPLYVEYNQDDVDDVFIADALIYISDGESSVPMNWNSELLKFTVQKSLLKIEPGRTYSITASANGYESISASTTIPSKQNTSVELVSYDSVYNSNCSGYDQFFKLKYTDLEGSGDNYMCKFIKYDSTIYDSIYWGTGINGLQVDFNDDSKNDKATFYLNAEFSCNGQMMGNPGSESYKSYVAQIKVCDRSYYLFSKSTQYSNSGNPFSEPTIVYSNVKNGLGCFGSYRVFEKKLDL